MPGISPPAAQRRARSPEQPLAEPPHSPTPPADGIALRPVPLRRSATQEGFICVLCLDILIDPITLECGHTCCRQCFVAYIEDKLRGLVPNRVDCPTGARCQLPIKVPAINLTLKNTIEANYAERVAARRSEEGRLSAADMQQRARSIERLALPAFDHAQRQRTRPYMSVIICLWLAFLAGRSSLPTSLRSSLRTYVDEAPWSGEQLYEWVQADVSNRRLFMWETSTSPIGSRKLEAGSRRQEVGGRSQEAGGRRQEAGGRKQEAGGGK